MDEDYEEIIENKEIIRLITNWHQNGNLQDGYQDWYDDYEVGKKGVTKIVRTKDNWFFIEGLEIEVTNTNTIFYKNNK